MPLKHLTETILVALLASAIIVTGVLISSLPFLPQGLLPWAIVFGLTLAYPLALYSLLRRNRADYWFRALHFAPAVMALLWLVIQAVTMRAPALLKLHRLYTWGFTMPAVVIALVLLALFCLHVIRRRVPRLFTLLALLAVFVGVAAAAETAGGDWTRRLTAMLWEGKMTAGTGSTKPVQVVQNPNPSSANLSVSGDKEEEEWRQKLRSLSSASSVISRRSLSSKTLAQALSSAKASVKMSSRGSSVASNKSSSPKPAIVAVKPPTTLPSSGFGMEAFTGFFAAAYCGVLHTRARRRVRSA